MSNQRQPAIGFIFITLLLDVIGFGIVIPVFPSLISELIHGSISEASLYGGWLIFAFAFTQFLFAPILGNLSDQYGRRPVLLASLFMFGVNYLILGVSPTLFWLFLGRVLSGITGASFTTASAYIADVSSEEKRTQNFGMIGVAFGLGFIIGPVIGGVLGQFGPRVPFFAAAALTFANWLYGYFILPESLAKENRRKFSWHRANPIGTFKHLRKYPVVSGLVVSVVLTYIAQHAIQSTWPFFTMETFKWDEAMVGYSLGFVGLLVAIVQGYLIRIINPKLGDRRSVYYGLILTIIGFFLFSFANEGWMLFVILIPFSLGGIAGPALQAIISNQVPANEQGELQGGLTSLMSVTSIIGPPLMTNLFSYSTQRHYGIYFPGSAFLLAAILCIISLYLIRKSFHNHNLH